MLHHNPRRPPAPTPRDARRELRIPVSLEGVMGSTLVGRRKVVLLDLSCYGCRVSTVLNLVIGSTVVITIADLAPLGAQVRWLRQGNMGLRFNTALHPTVVTRIRSLPAR